MNKIIELNNNEWFNNIICENVLEGLLSNGYTLHLTPCRYSENEYTLMIEIGEIDESFLPEPTEAVNDDEE